MPLPPEVTDLKITEGVSFSPSGDVTPVLVVSFMAGAHGPFRLEIPRNQFSPELVQRLIEREVRHLRELGALPPASS